MEKVDFTFRRGGRTKTVTSTQAKVLQRAGLGTYQTRDMAFQPMVTKPMKAEPATAKEPELAAVTDDAIETDAATDDGLEALDKEQLHALAKERGVRVHHMAGADKVRVALREAA
jgi:hypothetical protein